MHKKLKLEISYDDIFCSFSQFKKSYFRKPNPGMILKAVKKHKINLNKSFLYFSLKIDDYFFKRSY